MRVPSTASAKDSWTGPASGAGVFLVVTDVVHARDLFDLEARHLPCALNDPRQRAVEPRRFILDVLQHCLREVEALLSLIAAGVLGCVVVGQRGTSPRVRECLLTHPQLTTLASAPSRNQSGYGEA